MNIVNNPENNTAIIAVSKRGSELGRRLRLLLTSSHLYVPEKFASGLTANEHAFVAPVKDVVVEAFHQYRSLVLIMAVGIAVRFVSTELRDKHKDPAVVVVGDAGAFAVSLLSGHLGGANQLAKRIAAFLGAQPVITTASESSGTISVDLLGKEFGWEIENSDNVTGVSAAVVNGDMVGIYQDAGERNWWSEASPLPENLRIFTSLESLCQTNPQAAIIITDRILSHEELKLLPVDCVLYRPRSLVVGVGCNRGTKSAVLANAVTTILEEHGLPPNSIRKLATIDLKRDEAGFLDFARRHGLPVDYFDKEALRQTDFPSHPSAVVLKHVGTPAVCESAAILSSGNHELVVPKETSGRAVTVAVARLNFNSPTKEGKLFLIGLGPGNPEHMTFRAREAIAQSEVVVGYTAYIKLVEPFIHGKGVIATGMGAEVKRAHMAIDLARHGKIVAFVSSGDSGIYGMAGLVGEILLQPSAGPLDVEVVPGITSLISAAALLGAPISSDFASISLSDYLVPWPDITHRLKLAAEGDFVLTIYNPRSKKRQHQLTEARDIMLQHRSPATPVGIVTNAYREGQQAVITTLERLFDHEIGMDTVIIVGNSTTLASRDRIVTPRGYGTKYDLEEA